VSVAQACRDLDVAESVPFRSAGIKDLVALAGVAGNLQAAPDLLQKERPKKLMSVAPPPSEIFQRAVKEGERRLDQSFVELLSTGFIAGFTIIFGLVALGIVLGLFGEASGGLGKLAGALAFGTGLVFLVVGRAELFSENFFDPVATIVERRKSGMILSLVRLWSITFLLNLVGGGLLAWILSVDGVLPPGAREALSRIAEE